MTLQKRILSILILITSWAMRADNSPIYFTNINNADGLINNHLNTIFKDSKGFMWFGTSYGLSRWDGYSFVNYTEGKDQRSLQSQTITSLQEDAAGNLWIQAGSDYTIFDYEKNVFITDIASLLKDSRNEQTISKIRIDQNFAVWVLYNDSKIFKYKKINETPQELNISLLENRTISNIQIQRNILWVIYSNGLIEGYNGVTLKKEYSFTYFIDNYEGLTTDLNLYADGQDLWVYSFSGSIGIYCINLQSKLITHLTTTSHPALSSNDVNSFLKDTDGTYWIGTNHGGINLYDRTSNQIQYITRDKNNKLSLCQDAITYLYEDRDGIIWIGTYKQGVSYYHKSIFKFLNTDDNILNTDLIPFQDINCFAEDKDALWIGSNGQGLVRYDYKSQSVKWYRHNAADSRSLASDIIVSLTLDSKGKLWVGTYLGGLDCFDGNTFTHYAHNPNDPYSLPSSSVWKTLEDRYGNYWVATFKGGLKKFEPGKGFISLKEIFNGKDINDNYPIYLSETSKGNILVATCYGAYQLDYNNRQIDTLCQMPSGSFRLTNTVINNIFEDRRGLIWMGTENGLNVYDSARDTLYVFLREDGLPQNTVRAMVEDDKGNIWLSTLKGISKVSLIRSENKYNFSFHNYTAMEGLQSDEFNQNAAIKLRSGDLIFAGSNGLNCFNPNNIISNNIIAAPAFSSFQLYGKNLNPQDAFRSHKILTKDISRTKEIVLHYDENDFAIGFSALSFFQPQKVNYQYKMEGYNDKWITLRAGVREVNFTNMDPGEYRFYLKASNNDNIWNEKPISLLIRIEPPLWRTVYAYIFYILVIASLIFYIRWKVRFRIRQRAYEQETKHKNEMDEMRLRFFTNVSHEFRSPLSLMIAPIENLLARKQSPEERSQLDILQRNANELKLLVDKLLDFRRLEKGNLQLQCNTEDIVGFTLEVARSFSNLAQEKNIHYSFRSSVASVKMPYDAEKIHRIMMNLLSNAFKFTPKDGHIGIVITIDEIKDKKSLLIKVKDTGIGIKDSELPHIFERFYQAQLPAGVINHGSGIGLNMAKEYALLHNGDLSVESQINEGSSFTLHLPLNEECEISSENDISLILIEEHKECDEKSNQTVQKDDPVLLIADDNTDFRTLIKETFQNTYNIIEASDGKQALQLTFEKMPNIIITDLMMPEMNGIELCRAVRTDIRTSHIPIIILTAKNSEESMKEGFETGADYYMTKPFNMDLLFLRIKRIAEQQKNLHSRLNDKVAHHMEIKGSEIQIRSLDEKLIENAIAIVERRMNDPEFSVEELSRELAMSRVYLYKKVISLTGKSPIEFVRLIRLQRAAQLLKKSQLSVSEIAYQVGFNNPKYFTKYFKEEYKILPSEYSKQEYSVQSDSEKK